MTPRDDWEELNALADGELGAAARLRLRDRLSSEPDLARAYAEIAAIKARLGTLERAAPRRFGPTAAVGLAAAVCVALALLGTVTWFRSAESPSSPADLHATLSEAKATSGIVAIAAPDLSGSNLSLVAVRAARMAQGRVTAWHYRGPRGCALTILKGPGLAPMAGALRHYWREGGTGFLALARGMDAGRFRAVARYAEAETSRDARRDELLVALRDSTRTARRCV